MAHLHGVNEALVECKRDDVESKVPHTGLGVEEGLQHLLQVELHDGAAHTRRDVSHLLQVLLLRQFLPCTHTQTHTQKIKEGFNGCFQPKATFSEFQEHVNEEQAGDGLWMQVRRGTLGV